MTGNANGRKERDAETAFRQKQAGFVGGGKTDIGNIAAFQQNTLKFGNGGGKPGHFRENQLFAGGVLDADGFAEGKGVGGWADAEHGNFSELTEGKRHLLRKWFLKTNDSIQTFFVQHPVQVGDQPQIETGVKEGIFFMHGSEYLTKRSQIK